MNYLKKHWLMVNWMLKRAESAFDVLYTLPTSESILSGKFIGDVFVYTTGTTNRLNYFVGVKL